MLDDIQKQEPNWLLERRKFEEEFERTDISRRLEGSGWWLITRDKYVERKMRGLINP